MQGDCREDDITQPEEAKLENNNSSFVTFPSKFNQNFQKISKKVQHDVIKNVFFFQISSVSSVSKVLHILAR